MDTFEEWKTRLIGELTNLFGNGEEYIRQTGDDCWKEMYDDGLSVYEAAHEEYLCACEN